MSIELQNLSYEYSSPKTLVLNTINLKINTGEVVALMGGSGSGKSTLIKIISSFLKPTSGKVLINGNEVALNRPFKSIAYVSQSSIKTLFPWLTVEQNIYYPNTLRNQLNSETKEYCNKLLKTLGIEKIRKSFPLKLSGGEQKRLSLGVALSYRPEIILLDEPLSGIDFKLAEELWDILYSDFQTRNPTVLFVTHSLDEATILADRVIFLNGNKQISEAESSNNNFETNGLTNHNERYKLLFNPTVIAYRNYLLETFNIAMNE
ncbi:MAG: Bicarbonate transport ATP-binding protein CmpD [Ignavibacteria bacterium]|nr:Bicarbonate transport ATP-binding protein CmpD [Ignavibacteria bacterium]